MSTKFKEQMIMTTLHHHQTYYTTFKASWVNSILAFWAVSLFILAVCFLWGKGSRSNPHILVLIPKLRTKQRCPYLSTLRLKWLAMIIDAWHKPVFHQHTHHLSAKIQTTISHSVQDAHTTYYSVTLGIVSGCCLTDLHFDPSQTYLKPHSW